MPIMSFEVKCEDSYGLPVFPAYIGTPMPMLSITENANRLMKSKSVLCTFDTGANITSIGSTLFKKITLPRYGSDVRLVSPNADKMVEQYLASICLPNNFVIAQIPICVVDFGDNPIELNIGMDIIRHGDFSLTHRGEDTFLSFSV